MRILQFVFILICLGSTLPALCQTDTTVVKVDSTLRNPGTKTKNTNLVEKAPSQKSEVFKDSARIALEKMPRQAAIRSLMVPGLGQIGNKQWWKLPFVYGGYIGVGLVFEFNNRFYQKFLKEAQYRVNNNNKPGNPIYAGYSKEGIISAKDFYRRNRDLSVLGFVAFHALQAVDAYVAATFFRYEIGKDLSLNITPTLQSQPYSSGFAMPAPAIKINLSL